MTDVRLTATNPDDSSVVPVACNERGELLVTEAVVEQIDNDLKIGGSVDITIETQNAGVNEWKFGIENGALTCYRRNQGNEAHNIGTGGKATHRRIRDETSHVVELCDSNRAYRQTAGDTGVTYSITWGGVAAGTGFRIFLEPDNPAHYSSLRNAETGEETKEYIGPVLDVQEELEFLRSQVRALMERLKMTPEGGWPVWDGSDESQ